MTARKYDVVIVGSGAGGATLARELSKKGKHVLVVERGRAQPKMGTLGDAVQMYDVDKVAQVPRKSKEGVILWRALTAGGSTTVACGNAVRCLEPEMAGYGINLEHELAEAERDLHVAPIAERLLSEGSERIRWAAGQLGYRMDPMPKCVDAQKCRKCGQCVLGCRYRARWSAADFLQEAVDLGAHVWYDTAVDHVAITNGRATGVVGTGPRGRLEVGADRVVLAAGGLGSPAILQKSGVADVGSGLFVDLLVNTYGVTHGVNLTHEPTMALVNLEFHETQGFLLSPFVNHPRRVRLVEAGLRAAAPSTQSLIGIMTKIADDPAGHVYPDGSVSKHVTQRDREKLRAGATISREILVKAGAKPGSILTSHPQGAHPGGTAAVGRVVDSNLQTKVEGLFVCDASVLPVAPGLPPILTIVALSKRLAKILAG